MSLLQKFGEYWKGKGFILPGQFVLLAVSGGGDSMVMADLFLKSDIRFAVAHCNFGLRGRESDLDEQLVKDWCIMHEVKYHGILFDTKQKALEWKTGTQETARILRYEWFEQLRSENNYAKVITAHHADDNVETMLINLFKGTGIGGMHGIRPQNGNIIRPLLFATKEELAAYAAEHSIAYREDASNASDDYLRNAVRHNIVPAIKQWFPNAVVHVNESIVRFSEAEVLFRKAIEQERKKLLERRGNDYYIPLLKLRGRDPLATIVYELLQPFGFTSGQLPHILNLLTAESGRYITSATHRLIRDRDFVVITTIPDATADMVVIEGVPCTVDAGKYHYSFSVQQRPKIIPQDADEAFLDLENIEFPILLRKWRTGDYLYPLGMKMKKKKVSRLLIDGKVALHDKEEIRILECGKRIAWVSGLRLDERFRIKDTTGNVLVVKRELKN